jgi:hypothetical protein
MKQPNNEGQLSAEGFAVTGGMFYAAVVNGASPIGTVFGLSSNDGFLVHALFILILTCASTPISKGGAVCGNPARTDLCGGRAAMLVPTATPPRNGWSLIDQDDGPEAQT